MITNEKIDLYLKYQGNADMFAYTASPSDRQKISDNDWIIIREILSNVKMLNSPAFAEQLKQKMIDYNKSNTENEAVLSRLTQISEK